MDECDYYCARSLGEASFEITDCKPFNSLEAAILDMCVRITISPALSEFLAIVRHMPDGRFRAVSHADVVRGVINLLDYDYDTWRPYDRN